jgi:hypothetical protein
MSLQTCHKCHFRRPTLTPHRSIHSVFIRSWIHLSISQLAQQARHEISHQSSLCLSVSVCASALTRKLLRACFTCLKVLKKRSWNWITKEVRLLVEEKKQTSRILCVQDKAKITTGPSTSTHWRSTDAQNTVSEAHDSAFRALASLSVRVLACQSLSVCVCVLESYGILSSFMIPAMKQP